MASPYMSGAAPASATPGAPVLGAMPDDTTWLATYGLLLRSHKHSAVSVWTVLAEEEECDLSQAEIAARLGISESTVSEAVTALRLTGWAQCVEDRHSRGRTNRLRALRVPGRRYERGEYRGTGGQPGAYHRDSDHLLQVYRSLGGREGEKDIGSKAATLARKCEEEGLPAEQIIREAFRGRRRPPSMGMILRHRQALAAALRARTVSQPSQPSVTPSPRHAMEVVVESDDPVWRDLVRDDPTCRVIDDLVIRVDAVDHGDQTDEDAERLAREILAEGRAAGAGGPVRVTVTYYTDDRNGHARAEVSDAG